MRQREAQLAQARVDLDRTAIRAPVDGIVVKRSVEPGQTVAASLQAPELFVIATNLTDMQVETSIDEADVGRLRVGQKASFTVDAFPGRRFKGEVKQVRKAAQVVSNVVTYTVVVSAANPDLILLPGMTANVRIVTAQKDTVLKVANAALRFRPPAAATPRSRRRRHGHRGRKADKRQGSAERRAAAGKLWVLGDDGKPAAIEVRLGHHRRQPRPNCIEATSRKGREVIVGTATPRPSRRHARHRACSERARHDPPLIRIEDLPRNTAWAAPWCPPCAASRWKSPPANSSR